MKDPQSRFGDKSLVIRVECVPYRTAVLNTAVRAVSSFHRNALLLLLWLDACFRDRTQRSSVVLPAVLRRFVSDRCCSWAFEHVLTTGPSTGAGLSWSSRLDIRRNRGGCSREGSRPAPRTPACTMPTAIWRLRW